VTVPVRLDLHVHSRYSPDSRVPVDAFVNHLGAVGLNGFALTDHNTVGGHGELGALAQRHPEVLLVPGVEVSTIEGHLLVYGIPEAPPPRRELAETVSWVQAHGGEAVPAHPFRWTHGVGGRVAQSAPVSALETTNGHNSRRANLRASRLATARKLGATGGSDAHTLADLGRAFTEVPDGTASVDELLEAIRRGRSLAGGGPAPLALRVRLVARSTALRIRRGFRTV